MTGTRPHEMPRFTKNEWWKDAACRGQPWVSEARNTPAIRAAKRLCQTCPVISDCLKEALAMEARLPLFCRHGVAGGLSKKERYQLSRSVCLDCGEVVPIGDIYCTTHKATRKAEAQRRHEQRRREGRLRQRLQQEAS